MSSFSSLTIQRVNSERTKPLSVIQVKAKAPPALIDSIYWSEQLEEYQKEESSPQCSGLSGEDFHISQLDVYQLEAERMKAVGDEYMRNKKYKQAHRAYAASKLASQIVTDRIDRFVETFSYGIEE